MAWNEPEQHNHLHAHALLDTPARKMLEAARQNSACWLPDARQATTEGSVGHPAPVWMDPDELFEAELVPVESSQNG